jgi:hypothetical protein
MSSIKISDAPGYERDLESGAVVLKDKERISKYESEKRKKLEEIRKMKNLEETVELLKSELQQIKEMLLKK